MTSRTRVDKGAIQCIRIARIRRVDDTARHFDTVLAQLQPSIGEISRFQMWDVTDPDRPELNTTVAWLQVKDRTKTNAALVALNGANFHGKRLEAALAWYNFNNIDSSYVPRCTPCTECDQFQKEWKEYRQKIMQGLFEKEIDRIAAHITEHKHPKHNPALDRGEALQQLRIQGPMDPRTSRIDQATSCEILSTSRDPVDPDDDERDSEDARSSSIRTLHLSEYDMGAP